MTKRLSVFFFVLLPSLFFSQSCIDCTLIDPDAICTTIFAPVCGCDGITYSNECVAINSAGLVSYENGPCPNVVIDQCVDVSGIDFGLCTAIIGYAMINGECQAVSGCSTTDANGNDFAIAFYETLAECTANCDCPIMGNDSDMDGVIDDEDCAPQDPTIYPGAPEICDGLDNDCDNEIDEGLPTFTYYLDADEDGYGVPADSLITCSDVEPIGWAGNIQDCDDGNPEINPEAEDIPNNGIDEDCDGLDLVNSLAELEALGIRFYPNPVKNLLIVENLFSKSLVLKVFDFQGKMVLSEIFINERKELNTSSLQPGIYHLQFENKDKRLIQKFVKIE